MARPQQHTWLETVILVVGVVQLALVATFAGRFHSEVDPVREWQVLGVWALGVILTGVAVSRGRTLGWRHLLAIGPGLAAVTVMPKVGAIVVLFMLGAILLHRAHQGRTTSSAHDSELARTLE